MGVARVFSVFCYLNQSGGRLRGDKLRHFPTNFAGRLPPPSTTLFLFFYICICCRQRQQREPKWERGRFRPPTGIEALSECHQASCRRRPPFSRLLSALRFSCFYRTSSAWVFFPAYASFRSFVRRPILGFCGGGGGQKCFPKLHFFYLKCI